PVPDGVSWRRGLSRQGGHPPPLGPEMDDGPDAGHGVTVNMVGTGAEPSRTPLHRCTDAPMHRW
ncbi:hypothetical protein M3C67_002400, partial [Micrococcus luteus]|nr:hypothetical protein [Micrococcus luteus]